MHTGRGRMKHEIVKSVIKEYGTPSYIFDLDSLRKRIRKIGLSLEKYGISTCYAMKANPFLISILKEEVEYLEVCSPGEFRICEREQVSMDKLVISGVNKEPEKIEKMIETYEGKGKFTIESRKQLETLAECAKASGKQLSVLIRLTSGNQFGVEKKEAEKMLAERERYPQLHYKGIQYYSGTQKKDVSIMKKELNELDEFCESIKKKLGFQIEELEYGPGFFISYFQKEVIQEEEILLKEFCEMTSNLRFKGKIILEMGRYLAAPCGSYLTTIVERKENAGQIFGIVDGGIHHLNYYGQTMAMKIPHFMHISGLEESLEQQEEKWNICGSLCTVADVIVKQLPLIGAKAGDVIVFKSTGAYSPMEGISLFLSRDLPKVLFYSKEHGIELIRDSRRTDEINSRN